VFETPYIPVLSGHFHRFFHTIADPGFITIDENITGKLREAVENSIPKQEREAKIQLGQISSEYVVLRDDIYKILADLERKWKLL